MFRKCKRGTTNEPSQIVQWWIIDVTNQRVAKQPAVHLHLEWGDHYSKVRGDFLGPPHVNNPSYNEDQWILKGMTHKFNEYKHRTSENVYAKPNLIPVDMSKLSDKRQTVNTLIRCILRHICIISYACILLKMNLKKLKYSYYIRIIGDMQPVQFDPSLI